MLGAISIGVSSILPDKSTVFQRTLENRSCNKLKSLFTFNSLVLEKSRYIGLIWRVSHSNLTRSAFQNQ